MRNGKLKLLNWGLTGMGRVIILRRADGELLSFLFDGSDQSSGIVKNFFQDPTDRVLAGANDRGFGGSFGQEKTFHGFFFLGIVVREISAVDTVRLAFDF